MPWKATGLRKPAALKSIIGKTDYDLSPAFLADQFRLDDEHVLTGKRIVNRIEQVGQPDGQNVWNVTNKIPLFNADGAIIGTAGITRRLSTPWQDTLPGSEFGPVLAHMRDHYNAPITNQQLAKLADMSVRTFERKFQSSFHLTPQKYLRKLQDAHSEPMFDLHSTIAGGSGAMLRLWRSKPLLTRISSSFRPDAPAVSRGIRSGTGR